MHSNPPRTAADLRVHATLLAVQVAFATLAVAGKIAINRRGVTPEMLAFVRCLGGALIFGGVDLLLGARHAARSFTLTGPIPRRRPRMPLRDLLLAATAALLGVAANQLLFLNGLRHTTAINAVVIVATIPVWTVLLGLLIGRERPRLGTALGICVSLSGVLYLVGPEGLRLGGDTALGDLLILANCASYAGYLVIARGLIVEYGAPRIIPIAFVTATLAVLPFAWRDLAAAGPAIPEGAWPVTAYIVLVPTVLAYFLNAWALGRAPASVVAAYTYVQPVFASLFAVWLLDESLNARTGTAALLIFLGLALVNRASRSALPPATLAEAEGASVPAPAAAPATGAR